MNLKELARSATWLLAGYLPVHALVNGVWPLGMGVFVLSFLPMLRVRWQARLRPVLSWFALVGGILWVAVQVLAVLPTLQSGTRAVGTLHHANTLGASMLATSLVLVVVGERLHSARYLVIITVSVALLLMVASGSRSLLMGVGAAIILTILWRMRGRFSYGAIITLVTVLALVSLGFVINSQFLRSGTQGSFERLPIYSAALDLVTASPWFGLGPEGWQDNISRLEPSFPDGHAPHEHSVPLQILIAGGSLGFVLIFVIALQWLSDVIRPAAWRSSWLHALAVMAVVGLLLQSLVDVTSLYPAVYIPLVIAGILFLEQPPLRSNQ